MPTTTDIQRIRAEIAFLKQQTERRAAIDQIRTETARLKAEIMPAQPAQPPVRQQTWTERRRELLSVTRVGRDVLASEQRPARRAADPAWTERRQQLLAASTVGRQTLEKEDARHGK